MKEFFKKIATVLPEKVLKTLVVAFSAGIALGLLEIIFSVAFMMSFFPRFFTKDEIFLLWGIFVLKLVSQIFKLFLDIWKAVVEVK